jgi:hypothetical protein
MLFITDLSKYNKEYYNFVTIAGSSIKARKKIGAGNRPLDAGSGSLGL